MKKVLLILAIVFGISTNLFAIDFSVTGVTVTATYTEPSTNADNSSLTDLDHTSIYYDMGMGQILGKSVPASSLVGGGNISTSFAVPVSEGMEKDIDFWATAWDTSQNESEKSNIMRKRIDRLRPAPPK